MKTSSIVIASLFIGLAGLQAQPAAKAKPADTDYAVTERGANHRVWQRTTYEQGPNGKMFPHVHSYTELATGMHYKDAQTGQWVESKEEIEAYPSGAIARQGQYQVIFANNLNSAGAIDMQTPDGKRLRSNILGLGYYDSATGQSVLIAQLRDSQGELIADNQVLYPNAFEGVKADVRYTYKKGSFEQDVILREQPPTPESLGLNADTTELEVMTEFIDPPQEAIKEKGANSEREKGVSDQEISWGSTRLVRGRAFDLGVRPKPGFGILVEKQYITNEGRKILVETVPVNRINSALAKLPLQSSLINKSSWLIAKGRSLPKTPTAIATKAPMKLAQATPPDRGYVLDYVLINTDLDDMTFQGDMTYLISGGVNINGAAVIEGGTVVKYGVDTNNLSIIQFWGSLVCNTSPYRPAVFTSQNDDSVGENLNVGGPMNYFQAICNCNDYVVQIHNVRISYADYGIHTFNLALSDCQLVSCQNAIQQEWGDCSMTNVLMQNVGTPFTGTQYNFTGYYVTINGCSDNRLSYDWDSPGLSTVTLTNSLLVNVGVDGDATITTNYTARLTGSSSSVFQTVGAGSCYLTTNSPYRNAGTTNIDLATLADMAAKTTYPPVVYSNTTISVATTFSPQAQRDADVPDLGYHYDPLDYVFGASIAKSNLTFTAGTTAGYFYNSSGGTYGLALGDSATASFCGTATSPCRWVKYNAVQEGGNGLWKSQSWLGGITGQSFTYAAPAIRANFTICSLLAGEGNLFRDNWTLLNVCATNCEFWTGNVAGYYASLNLVNCLFVNDYVGLWWNYGAANITMQGCTMIRGNFYADHDHSGDWPVTIVNCAFDGTAFYMNPHSNSTNGYYSDYNAFLSGSNQTFMAGSHDLILTSGYNWQTSWLGDFYLPYDSALIDAGSTNADLLGLYHFTTQVYQAKETNSLVDIGYHYVAVDYYTGIPVDTDGDGISDYLEDANGNGTVDSGETDWQNAFDLGFRVRIVRPRNSSSLP